jgi:hypothetical protein
MKERKNAMPKIERLPKCDVCGIAWIEHSPDCIRHAYRPSAEPDPGAEARRLEEGKALNRAVARRRDGDRPRPQVESHSTCTGRDVGTKGALAGRVEHLLPYVQTEASGAEVLDAIVSRNGAIHE